MHYKLGNFSRGRIYQTRDGRFHYFLTRGEWFNFDLYYSVGPENDFETVSAPIRLETPSKIDHIYVNAARAGGTSTDFVDCYFTGRYSADKNESSPVVRVRVALF